MCTVGGRAAIRTPGLQWISSPGSESGDKESVYRLRRTGSLRNVVSRPCRQGVGSGVVLEAPAQL